MIQERTWRDSSAPPALEEGLADVWRVRMDLDSTLGRADRERLSGEERERAGRYRFERDRRRYESARSALRRVLGYYLEADPRSIMFSYSHYGKPAINSPLADGVAFNIGHSRELCLMAFSLSGPVGVDIEFKRLLDDMARVAGRFFARSEFQTLQGLPDEDKVQGFFSCWTRKEAFIKALGEGLSHPLDRFEVSLKPGDPAELLAIDGSREKARSWSMFDLPADPEYAAALVAPGDVKAVRLWNYDWGG